MASIYDFKPAFQNLLRPLTQALAKRGITPNQITIAALILSIICGAVIALAPGVRALYYLVPVVLFVRMALNAIDGMLAREHNMVTTLGGFLNELGDVYADAALYLPLALVPGLCASIVVVTVLLGVGTELAGVLAKSFGGTRRYDGPMGKSDRATAFGALYLVLALVLIPIWTVNFLLVLIGLLSLLTIRNRVVAGLGEIAK